MAQVSEPYNPLTLELFGAPRHGGALPASAAASGYAEEGGSGAAVELAVELAGETLQSCRFLAFGCPHLLAAAEWWCRRAEGQAIDAVAAFSAADCIRELDVPIDKTGRILLLEDALRSLQQQLDAACRTQG